MFRERLKLIREKENLTQLEIAKKLNISVSTYNAYETGKQYPKIDVLKSFCEAFNVSSDWLLGLKKQSAESDSLLTKSDVLKLLFKLEDSEIPVRSFPLYYAGGVRQQLVSFISDDLDNYFIEKLNTYRTLKETINKGELSEDVLESWVDNLLKDETEIDYFLEEALADDVISYLDDYECDITGMLA